MKQRFRRLVLDLVEPMLKWINKIHAPWTHKKVTLEMVKHLLSVLRPGDVICAIGYGEATNILIAGEYKHACIFVGGETIVEAVSPHVRIINIFQLLMCKDRVIACRKTPYSEKIADKASSIALQCVGKPYDFDFDLPIDRSKPNKAFYCAELVWWAHFKANPLMEFRFKEVWGVPTVIPDDFIYATKHWKVVWQSDNKV